MRRAFHNLFRKGEANAEKVVCLTFGLALGLLLLAQVIFERSYDSFIPRLADTYQINTRGKMPNDAEWKTWTHVPGGVATGMKELCPGIEAATRLTGVIDDAQFVTEDGRELQGNLFLCDSAFFDVFPRHILMGEEPRTGLAKANQAYISATLAESFGPDVVGKQVKLKSNEKIALTVAGVFEDLPDATHLPDMDILCSMPTIGQIMWDGSENWVGNDRYLGYLRLAPGFTSERLQPDIERVVQTKVMTKEVEKSGIKLTFQLKPVSEIHASSDYNRLMNWVYLIFAILLLGAATFNYLLLVVSSMVNRAKSIATYRCYGADGKDICRMVLAESSLHCLLALAAAMLVLFSLRDFLPTYLGHTLQELFPLSTVWVCLAVTVVVALICGALPGWLYTRIPLVYAYRHYTENKHRWKLGLLFVQFLLSTLFVSLLAVVSLQYDKLIHTDLGFSYDRCLRVSLEQAKGKERNRLCEELRKLPFVEDLTWGYQNLSEGGTSGNIVYRPDTGEDLFNVSDLYWTGPHFLRFFQIEIEEGGFDEALNDTTVQQVMVSRRFVERMEKIEGWKAPYTGRHFFMSGHENLPCVVKGVYRDIQVTPLLQESMDERPTVMYYFGNFPYNNLYIRLSEMGSEQIQQVQQVVDEVLVDAPQTAYLMSVELGQHYDGLKHVRGSLLFAGGLVLLITFIGLVAYLRDEVNRRRRELAIRIIFGSTPLAALRLFLHRLQWVLLPALCVGAMVAYAVSERILQLFAVRVSAQLWFFALLALLVGVVACAFSAWMVLRAIRLNPRENLYAE